MGAIEKRERLLLLARRARSRDRLHPHTCLEIQVIGFGVRGLRQIADVAGQLDHELRTHFFGHRRLQCDGIGKLPVEVLRPQVHVVACIDELQREAYRLTLASHRAFQHVGDVQFLRDVVHGLRCRAIYHHRRAGYDLEVGGAIGDRAQDFLVHAVGEECVGRIGTQILERQHGQSQP